MTLRALGSLLTRRFSPLGNPSAQAVSSLGIAIQKAAGSAAGRPARSFHTLRDLAVGGGVYGAAATASLAGLVAGILYLNKDSVAETTREEAGKEVGKKAYVSREGAIKLGFVHGDGEVNWTAYFDYVNSQTNYGGMPLYDKEVSVKEVTDGEAVKLEDIKVDGATMKTRFEDWMKEYGRSYRTLEEKARRYEIFKQVAIDADKFNSSKRKGARTAGPNGLADWTSEELKRLDNDDFDWETYVDHINNMAAHGWYIGHEQFTVSEAVKKRKEQLAKETEEGTVGQGSERKI
ncbi:unnamed protein product [Urochloa humidicola]